MGRRLLSPPTPAHSVPTTRVAPPAPVPPPSPIAAPSRIALAARRLAPAGAPQVRPAPTAAGGPADRQFDGAPRRSVGAALRDAVRRGPGWPLRYLLVGFPVWWVLGLSTLIFVVAALPMAAQVQRWRRAGRLSVPPVFAIWALFLAWQVIGLATLDRSPPGTHPGSESGRLVSLFYTLIMYAAVTVVLVYVANLPVVEVSQQAIGRWMGWFFVTVACGGFLGMLRPGFGFRSPLEYLLPHAIAANAFVSSSIHPVAAQVQNVIGEGNGRPAAPFGYTNLWGNTLSLLVVWFVAQFVVPARGWRRIWATALVAVTIVPVIYSLNRGLWIGVGVTVVWVLLRQLSQGRVSRVLAVVAAATGAGIVLVVSPLFDVITARLNHGVSNSIRAFVDHLSVVAVQHSPIIGYGGNRHADGSASSIAVGPSASCSGCGSVATGSTGQLWSVLFNNGIVGTIWYFGFFAAVVWMYRSSRGALNEAALVTIVLGYVYMFFYSSLPVAPALTMVAVGVLWREPRPAPQPGRRR